MPCTILANRSWVPEISNVLMCNLAPIAVDSPKQPVDSALPSQQIAFNTLLTGLICCIKCSFQVGVTKTTSIRVATAHRRPPRGWIVQVTFIRHSNVQRAASHFHLSSSHCSDIASTDILFLEKSSTRKAGFNPMM